MIACCLMFVVSSYLILANVGNKKLGVQSTVRNIELKKEAFDAQNYLESFDDALLTTEGTITSFTGSQKIDSNLLDYISETEGLNYDEPESETLIQYFATYDSESSVVTLSAKIIMSNGIEELDEIYGVAFIDKNGEIDAIMNIDGESILLSEIKQQVLIENCGWLSKLIKVAVAAVVVVVAIVASPVVAAVVAVATMAIIIAEDAVIEANYKHNKKNKDPGEYINNQNDSGFQNWKFGVSTMDKNGCGVIAVYNLLRMRGEPKNLADVAYEIENNTGTLILGIFGTDPTHFGEYFRSKKIKVTEYTDLEKLEKAAENISTSQKIVLEIWNEPSILKGAHAVAVEKVDKIFYIYNGEYNGALLPYNTLNEYISKNGGSLIIGYVVG